MLHPSLCCRAADGCAAPPVARLSVAPGGDARPALIAIRPVYTGVPAGVLSCAEHLHSAVDQLLMAALPPVTP